MSSDKGSLITRGEYADAIASRNCATDDLHEIPELLRGWREAPSSRLPFHEHAPSEPASRWSTTTSPEEPNYLDAIYQWLHGSPWSHDLGHLKRLFVESPVPVELREVGEPWRVVIERDVGVLSADRVESAIDASRALLDLDDDWDGEGAHRCMPETWARATNWLRAQNLAFIRSAGCGMPSPAIDLVPDGSIDIHWKTDQFELLVNIPPSLDRPASFYGDDFGRLCIKGTLSTRDYSEALVGWLSPRL